VPKASSEGALRTFGKNQAGLRGATQLELEPVQLGMRSKRPLKQQGGFSNPCPEPGTLLTVRANWQKFEVISVATIGKLVNAR
jgi:hypothetical protein